MEQVKADGNPGKHPEKYFGEVEGGFLRQALRAKPGSQEGLGMCSVHLPKTCKPQLILHEVTSPINQLITLGSFSSRVCIHIFNYCHLCKKFCKDKFQNSSIHSCSDQKLVC